MEMDTGYWKHGSHGWDNGTTVTRAWIRDTGSKEAMDNGTGYGILEARKLWILEPG